MFFRAIHFFFFSFRSFFALWFPTFFHPWVCAIAETLTNKDANKIMICFNDRVIVQTKIIKTRKIRFTSIIFLFLQLRFMMETQDKSTGKTKNLNN